MVDTVKTIGSTGDYADPILWAAGQGNVNDGNRQVGEMVENITMAGLFRPNQTWVNGGLLRGDLTVTGKTGDGRSLGNTSGTRICLSPSGNMDFEDIEFIKGVNTHSIQSITGSDLTRILSPDLSITPVATYTSVFTNVVAGDFDLNTGASATAQFNNVLATKRLIIRVNETLNFKNSISLASDWLLGRGTYSESETLVNYCYILQNAPAGDFGTGSSNNTLNTDATLEMVDFAGGDFRVKSTSVLATAGDTGGLVGAFLEVSSGTSIAVPFIGTEAIVYSMDVVQPIVVVVPIVTTETTVYSPTINLAPQFIYTPLIHSETNVYEFDLALPQAITMQIVSGEVFVYEMSVTGGEVLVSIGYRGTFPSDINGVYGLYNT